MVRHAEVRADDSGALRGTVITYGEEAEVHGFRERFAPGSLGDVSKLDVVLNVMHNRRAPIARTRGGTMRLEERSHQVLLEARPVDTVHGRDALEATRKGLLTGLSMEFNAER